MELNQLTIKLAQEGLKTKKFSSEELVRSCLERISDLDSKVKSFITVCKNTALENARQRDVLIQKGKFNNRPLLGIPVAIKDNFCTKGIRTTAASNVLKNYIPVFQSTVVKKLLDAGAVIIGKTNMDAWAHGSSTETSSFFTSRNPWDLKRVPGGSSGGSATAVISDETIFSIGSETAGSIRQPAAWCGVTGFKPTYGRVSRYGVIAMGSSLDCPGPMTKTVEDSALVLNVLAGKDPKDATTSSRSWEKIKLGQKTNLAGIRIGLPKEYFEGTEAEVANAVRAAVRVLQKKGAQARQISLLNPKYSVAVYTIIQRSEVSSNLGRYDGIRYGNRRDLFGAEAKRRVMLGTYALSAGYYDKYYRKAQKVRTLISQDFERVFKQVDLIVAPASPTTALKLGAFDKDPMFGEKQDILMEASALAGLPGLSICCGFSKQGLPIGMQLIGPQFNEALLAQAGYVYQRATDWHKQRPKL